MKVTANNQQDLPLKPEGTAFEEKRNTDMNQGYKFGKTREGKGKEKSLGKAEIII